MSELSIRKAFGILAVLAAVSVGGFILDRGRASTALPPDPPGSDSNQFNDQRVGDTVFAAWDGSGLFPTEPITVLSVKLIGVPPQVTVLGMYMVDRRHVGNGATMTGDSEYLLGKGGWKREGLRPVRGTVLRPRTSRENTPFYPVAELRTEAVGNHVVEGWIMTYRDSNGRIGKKKYVGELILQTLPD